MKEEDRKIGPEIHCTDLKLSRNLSAHVRKSGVDEVTMMHGWIIRYLYENREQDIFQKDIEQRFAVGRSTVTNLIQLMEKKGFVKRESVKQDARLKKVILTEKGIADGYDLTGAKLTLNGKESGVSITESGKTAEYGNAVSVDVPRSDSKPDDSKTDDTKKDDTSKDDGKKEDSKTDDTSKDDSKKDDFSKEDTSKGDVKKDDSNLTDKKKTRVIYLSPQGKTFNQEMAREFAKEENLIFLCGHYEGIDERVLEEIVSDYVSIGDYVLTGGELPALVMMDTISRLVPGVLNNDMSAQTESFSDNLLEYPQYTRPENWEGKLVPPVLLSGNHKKLAEWYREQSVIRTAKRRPDLIERAELTQKERELAERIMAGEEESTDKK